MKIFVTAALASFFFLFTAHSAEHKNIIVFVADGLRGSSVNAQDTPAFERVRTQGVHFKNSHSIFPTVTTANASVIATGHALGDTGNFLNELYVGYPMFEGRKIQDSASPILAAKKNSHLKDLNLHYGGNYLSEVSLLAWAREHGFATAAIGKTGPTLIQDVQMSRFAGKANGSTIPTVIIDGVTGQPAGVPLSSSILQAMRREGLPLSVPRNSNEPNQVESQRYFTEVFLKVILPQFKKSKKPFVAVYWCADPDASQHDQNDSLHQFSPGINGPTSLAGIKNADANLGKILAYLDFNPELAKSTNVIVLADHGFSTISSKWLNADRTQATNSYSARFTYRDEKGKVVTEKGALPLGFLAIDLAQALGMYLFDPDGIPIQQNGIFTYPRVAPRGTDGLSQFPMRGNGLIGRRAVAGKTSEADLVVASSGGCAFIYLTKSQSVLARQIVPFLATLDYVGGIFVNRKLCGELPGALGIDQIYLAGSTKLPLPTIVVPFRNFALDAAHPTQSQVLISDGLDGQGSHGSFGRGDTFNFMAAMGPDFKKRYVDAVPVSNMDVPITCARILGLDLPSIGHLRGRVIEEALVGGARTLRVTSGTLMSRPTTSGMTTRAIYQDVGKYRYFDAAGFPGRTVGISN